MGAAGQGRLRAKVSCRVCGAAWASIALTFQITPTLFPAAEYASTFSSFKANPSSVLSKKTTNRPHASDLVLASKERKIILAALDSQHWRRGLLTPLSTHLPPQATAAPVFSFTRK